MLIECSTTKARRYACKLVASSTHANITGMFILYQHHRHNYHWYYSQSRLAIRMPCHCLHGTNLSKPWSALGLVLCLCTLTQCQHACTCACIRTREFTQKPDQLENQGSNRKMSDNLQKVLHTQSLRLPTQLLMYKSVQRHVNIPV